VSDLRLEGVSLHGRHLAYRTAGSGEPVLFVHGITQDSRTWDRVGRALADDVRIVAPDLPGHGSSQRPAGDHSLGAYASTLRDLLFALEIPSATIVGHSLGGGVALQFAYQFPEMLDRIVLIDSGGLGRDVSPLLRAATLPGADAFLGLVTATPFRAAVTRGTKALRRFGVRVGTDINQALAGIGGLSRREARRSFLRTVDAVIAGHGQAVSATDKLYLAAHVPTLIVWGGRDRIIPVEHGERAHEAIPGSQLEVLDDAGHFPHLDAPDTVAALLRRFVADTDAADVPREQWGALLRRGDAGR
jgi:pimeloyl-ACP methyl ester carboxylesterase